MEDYSAFIKNIWSSINVVENQINWTGAIFEGKKCVKTYDQKLNVWKDVDENFHQPTIHAVHCFLYCHTEQNLGWDNISSKGIVLMQMRFDGRLGFHGGIVDDGEGLEDALTREVQEELGSSALKFQKISKDDLSLSLINSANTDEDALTNNAFHLYCKALPVGTMLDVEKNVFSSVHFGKEVLGLVRVPLWTLQNMKSGFPIFLRNKFAGCAMKQLLFGIWKTQLLDELNVLEACSNSYTID